MSRRKAPQPTVRELVEELGRLAPYLVRRKADPVAFPVNKRHLERIARQLEELTRPAVTVPPRPARLPGEGTVARAVLERLAADQLGKDHDELRMLTGLTDPELVARIVVNGRDAASSANTVRPRRVELVRSGLVEAVPDTAPARWRLTAMAEVLLSAQGVRCSRG